MEAKERERKPRKHREKDREKDKDRKKHKHRHKGRSRENDKDQAREKRDSKSGHVDFGGSQSKRHDDKVPISSLLAGRCTAGMHAPKKQKQKKKLNSENPFACHVEEFMD